jgi:catechol 2,3-dioxygenase-like lactoylglutathione lyase family enzyme
MSISINGIAHLQMNVSPGGKALEFWQRLCHFLEMETLLQGEDSRYFIGGRTGILVRELDRAHADQTFDQNQPGLHHLCFRARSREDVDQAYAFISNELKAHIIRAPKVEDHYAAGYYSILFEDPGGIRIEINHVPGQGHFGDSGRLGQEGAGPATHYGEDGLTGSLEP